MRTYWRLGIRDNMSFKVDAEGRRVTWEEIQARNEMRARNIRNRIYRDDL